jgi:hypothetical protein
MILRLSSSAARGTIVFLQFAHGVGICMTRYASEKLESKIQGTAWVDDLALIPENAGNAKP